MDTSKLQAQIARLRIMVEEIDAGPNPARWTVHDQLTLDALDRL